MVMFSGAFRKSLSMFVVDSEATPRFMEAQLTLPLMAAAAVAIS
jgi:hypothetical protein